MPHSREIVGYSGPSDVLVVSDAADKVVGIAIRHSYDTPSHVNDVKLDLLFMESWNGRGWGEIAEITDFNEAEIYAVSGATRTSEAVRESITHRLAVAKGKEGVKRSIRFGWKDALLLGFLIVGCLFAFWKNKRFQKLRWIYSVATIGGLGFSLAISLRNLCSSAWIETRVPWEATRVLLFSSLLPFLCRGLRSSRCIVSSFVAWKSAAVDHESLSCEMEKTDAGRREMDRSPCSGHAFAGSAGRQFSTARF